MKNILKLYEDTVDNSRFLATFKINSNFGTFKPKQNNIYNPKSIPKSQIQCLRDFDNTYEINSDGFRDKDFDNCDTLVAGCSVTFGVGIPEYGRWGNIIESRTNKKVANISFPGGSISIICNAIIKYCIVYGMPKNIFMFAPSLTRGNVVTDDNFYVSGRWGNTANNERDVLSLVTTDSNVVFIPEHDILEFTKTFDFDERSIENSISPHQFLHESLISLFMLESFCKTNNINFIWSTWSNSSTYIMKKLITIKDFFIKNYIEFSELGPKMYDYNDIVINCNSDHDSILSNEKTWLYGSDILYKKNKKIKDYRGHPGIHFNYHVADLFEKFIK